MIKLGPHCTRSTPAGAAWAQRAAIVKSLDNVGPLAIAPDHAIRIYRHTWPDQDLAARNGGEWMARTIIGTLGGYNHPRLYVEIVNEWKQAIDELPLLCDITESATKALHYAGYKVAGFCFSSGNPTTWQHWDYIKGRGFCGVDLIALHEYWASAGFSTWNALRYRRVHEYLQGQHPPFVVTECGRDGIAGEGGEGKPGWKLQGVSARQYADELLAYSAELEKDSYMLGATAYATGTWGDFAAFDLEDVAPMMPVASGPITIPSAPAQPPTGGGTLNISLAIFPSLQGNAYNGKPATEWSAMQWQADALLRMARDAGINARALQAPADTGSSTANLIAQQDAGYAWLDAQPQTIKIGLNLHTDSGDSHTFGIWTGRINAKSRSLAECLAPIVHDTLGTASVSTFDRLGTVDYNGYIFATHAHANSIPVLLELCSHQSTRDLDALWAAGEGLAAAIVRGIVAWAGAPADVSCARCKVLEGQLAAAMARLDKIKVIVG